MTGFLYGYTFFIVFLFGAVIGSFINVVIYRVPLGKGKFLGEKRSYCPKCGEKIKAYDLIPIASFLILRGKCRNCKEKISARYPCIELFCGLMAVCSLLRFGFGLEALFVFGVLVILTAIAMIDFDTKEIPNGLVIALIPFAIAAVFLYNDVGIVQRLLGLFAISLPMLIITLIISGAFGGGDIKLMAVCGFLLGIENVLVAFFITLLLGGGYAFYLLLIKKAKKGTLLAFGPYICIGVAVAMFFGKDILSWYLGFFR